MVVFLLAAAQPALAVQHLVRPGDSWSELSSRLQPGDEIILMPGRHRPASFDNLHGTRQRPITIRGLHPQHPAIIDGGREGIRLRRPQHVVIRDLAITGATVKGISISDESAGAAEESDAGGRWPAHVTIRNITIERTGPSGRRHGVRLAGVRHVHIDRVHIDGWGGSAVKVIACADVTIEQSVMRGREDHGQVSGVQIRAGSENIRIARCLIDAAGESAVVLGGDSAAGEFRPPPAGGRSEAPPEAIRVTVERNVLRRCESAVAFLSAERCVVRNNAIVSPARWVYVIAPSNPNYAASRGPIVRESTFSLNLIVWKPGELRALAHLHDPAARSPSAADGLTLEQNLWWSPEDPESRARLGDPVGKVKSRQVMDVDPDLDEQYRPQTRRARLFGPEGP